MKQNTPTLYQETKQNEYRCIDMNEIE